jgi:hypothetical protein
VNRESQAYEPMANFNQCMKISKSGARFEDTLAQINREHADEMLCEDSH